MCNVFCSDENCISLPSGDAIYGRVMVDPVQNLGDSFICNIEKVFLCTGADGYVPKYNPSNFEFGCLADAPSLLYRFKIIVSNKSIALSMSRVLCVHSNLNLIPLCVIFSLQDKAQPETQARAFGNVAFNAFLAVDDPGALALVRQPGSDGFRMDSSALFQVSINVKYMKHIQNTPLNSPHSHTLLFCAAILCFAWPITLACNSTPLCREEMKRAR